MIYKVVNTNNFNRDGLEIELNKLVIKYEIIASAGQFIVLVRRKYDLNSDALV